MLFFLSFFDTEKLFLGQIQVKCFCNLLLDLVPVVI